jgi:competence protein ComEC
VKDGFSRRDWLVDCGSEYAFDTVVCPALRLRGVNHLDGFVVTHGDSQRIGGGLDLLEQLTPAQIIDSPLKDRSRTRKWMQQTLEHSGSGKSILMRGDQITLAPGAVLHILFPPTGLSVTSADDKAFVCRLDIGNRRVLFTSDAGFLTEHWLLANAQPNELRSDILVKGMHASDFSGTAELLAAVQPQLLVCAGAEFPTGKQIRPEWADMVAKRGITLFRQDRTGAVHISLNSQNLWEASAFLGHETFCSSAR